MILPVLLLLGVIGAARAQQPDTQSATASVEELSAEIAALKAKTSTWDKVLAALPKISGYVQTGYEWSDNSSTFFIKRVRLNLAGAIAPKLDYRVQIEFASPKIVDAYLCYKPFDELNVQLGEYKLPFSIENTDYVPLRYEFIEYPLSLRKLMGFNDLCGLSATGRDMGAQLFGGFFKLDGYSILNYNFGVFNGEGLNVKDKNKSKDIVARLTVKPVAGLQFAGSYYWGRVRRGLPEAHPLRCRCLLRLRAPRPARRIHLRHDGRPRQRGVVCRGRLARGPDIVADGAVRYLSRRLLPRFEPPDQLYGRAYVATCEIPALPAGLYLRRFRRAGCRRSQCGGTDALRHILT